MTHDQIQAEFDKLNPWQTEFTFAGKRYGGNGNAPRALVYLDCPIYPSVLELGCFEGAHTLWLLRNLHAREVIAIDSRPTNLERAKVALRIGQEVEPEFYATGGVKFVEADLETANFSDYGHFDLVLCAGVLYHMSEPWRLIQEIGKVGQMVYIAGHFALDSPSLLFENGCLFGDYGEGGISDRQSGMTPKSKWLTLGSIIKLLHNAGYMTITIHHINLAYPVPRNDPNRCTEPYVIMSARKP